MQCRDMGGLGQELPETILQRSAPAEIASGFPHHSPRIPSSVGYLLKPGGDASLA